MQQNLNTCTQNCFMVMCGTICSDGFVQMSYPTKKHVGLQIICTTWKYNSLKNCPCTCKT